MINEYGPDHGIRTEGGKELLEEIAPQRLFSHHKFRMN
jgi:hypothetical protein